MSAPEQPSLDLFDDPPPVESTERRGSEFRLLHTADWHLGKLLGSLSREEEHDRFLTFLLDLIERDAIDALLISGDVFDSANPPQSALRRYYRFLSALSARTDCTVVVTAGNHDSPALIEAPRELLSALRVHVVGALPDDPTEALIPLPDSKKNCVQIAAVPFLRDRDVRTGRSGQTADEIRKDLADGIRNRYAEMAENAAKRDAPTVAMGHLTVSGATASESEREIHIGGLGAVNPSMFPNTFDYVALGHLHRPQAVGKDDRIRYSGSPIPLSFSEAKDQKSLRFLAFNAEGSLVKNESIAIPPARHLVQVKCPRKKLGETLATVDPPQAELTTWVEVVVEDALPGDSLAEEVQELVANQDYEIVQVIVNRASLQPALGDSVIDDAAAASLLEDHSEVFRIRLEQEEALTDDERIAAEAAFRDLLAIYDERQREEVAS